ncbi:HI1506-related protein [Klebsiella pneumoniae]|uniref:HI1506-related protein n=1 Tax=Klebsiella pneumoniae TaxID=573 RepID=UPI0009BAE89D|nr:HI1506-related protein [Klebsiella pneumoniae]SLR48073.1 Uncharacterised protein [Klebsiella pneumoniae]
MPEITITSKRDGFRRCGVAHRDVPVTWPDGSFTDEQIAILRAEPALVVHLGAVSGDDDKLKNAQARIQELEVQLKEVTSERDLLLVTLELQKASQSPAASDNAADDTTALTLQTTGQSPEVKDSASDYEAVAESSPKAKK